MLTGDKISFRDVKNEILGRIHAREWPPGSLMPGEIELAEEFGCARATVNRAMRELAEEGIIDRKRKAGTRVNIAPVRHAKFEIPLVRTEIESLGASYRYAFISRSIDLAPDWLRARICLGPDDQVLHIECMHYANNAPFQFEDRWINITAAPKSMTADFSAISPNEWLVAELPFSEAEISFSASAVDERLARFLSMYHGEPHFLSERVTWLKDLPITFAQMSYGRGYRMTTRY
ncbi:MAG: GntR family transcriptional regulator [Cohaesibacter sp.]|nr:GntR family transcriptional regulator [Cohaesibacter sp.]MCV6600088.1 GntR family transcriptional regulator [Cohaesibacter sp.]